jgi:hypothetical protein
VIIGGSHSGYSCAWMMLNGPSSYHKHNYLKTVRWKKFPEGHIYKNEECEFCCKCPRIAKCECPCSCLGNDFEFKEFDFDYEKLLPKFENGAIKILYRDKIRVFYDTCREAHKDGYEDYSKKDFPKMSCILYGYTGLRGDAKELHKQIRTGKEKRVQLVQAKTPEDQAVHVKDADIVIWACGYQTNKIYVRNQQGKKIQMSSQSMIDHKTISQYDVDDYSRLYLADGHKVLAKTFGAGIAYPQRRSDGMMLPKKDLKFDVTFYKYPRVDSFDLYRNYVGDTILKNILPKHKIMKMIEHQSSDEVRKIRNAQNKEYEKANDEYQKENHMGIKFLNLLGTHKTVELFQIIYKGTQNIYYGDKEKEQ